VTNASVRVLLVLAFTACLYFAISSATAAAAVAADPPPAWQCAGLFHHGDCADGHCKGPFCHRAAEPVDVKVNITETAPVEPAAKREAAASEPKTFWLLLAALSAATVLLAAAWQFRQRVQSAA
jgi:hypothetical protein